MIFGVVSQKGGVGKTTLVQNLGAELSGLGKRILLIDFDPLGNLSVGWKIDPDRVQNSICLGLRSPKNVRKSIIKLRPKLDLIPADEKLNGSKSLKFKQMLDEIKVEYDMILIDSSPNVDGLINYVIDVSDILFIPVQVHPFAYRAADRLFRQIEIRNQQKPMGIILTMVDQRNSLTKAIEHSARERFGKDVLKTKIPRNVDIAEAPLSGLPVSEYERTSKGAKAYRALAREVNKLYG